MDREERSKLLHEACGGDITPKVIAEKVCKNPDDYSPLEYWLAINYTNAMNMLDLDDMMVRLEAMIEKYKKG